jgi:hypothetical protein
VFGHAVLVGLSEPRRDPGGKQSKARNLPERLCDREQEILRFTDHLAVAPTNNGPLLASGFLTARPLPFVRQSVGGPAGCPTQVVGKSTERRRSAAGLGPSGSRLPTRRSVPADVAQGRAT